MRSMIKMNKVYVNKRKGQYFLLSGVILLVAILVFLVSHHAPESYNSIPPNIDSFVERTYFYGFSNNAMITASLLSNYYYSYSSGILVLYFLNPINDTYYNASLEIDEKSIKGAYATITLGQDSISLNCNKEYCETSQITQIDEKFINLTINLKYFMNNQIIKINTTNVVMPRKMYAYYYALKNNNLITGYKVIN